MNPGSPLSRRALYRYTIGAVKINSEGIFGSNDTQVKDATRGSEVTALVCEVSVPKRLRFEAGLKHMRVTVRTTCMSEGVCINIS